MTRSYPEPLRVTGPLLSLVLRTEDVWQRYNHFRSVRGSQSGFPLLTPIMETYDGPASSIDMYNNDVVRNQPKNS
jgi:hypothetical protein